MAVSENVLSDSIDSFGIVIVPLPAILSMCVGAEGCMEKKR